MHYNFEVIHNKDYSVVQTFKAALVAFFYLQFLKVLENCRLICKVQKYFPVAYFLTLVDVKKIFLSVDFIKKIYVE